MRYFNIVVVMCLLMIGTILFSRCFHGVPQETGDPRGEEYAAASTCISCHRQVDGSYVHNVHYKTSSAETPVARQRDRFYFLDSSYIRVEHDGRTFRQSSFTDGIRTVSAPFEVGFGSGEKAETYGYWKENMLYQLPLTYYASMHTWANSPGFTPRHPRYDRVITSRCFECHASYVKREIVRSGPLSITETLDKSSIVYGIDCQRCHGPALRHVKFHQENPAVKTARYIVSIKSLSRQQQLDICAVCHSGNDQSEQRSLFEFTPGDTLSHFYYPDFGADDGEPDVHGKQLQLLRTSLCFQKTNMTCTTCHDAHASQKDQLTVFASKCMDCHPHSTHTTVNVTSAGCIDCHMPLQTSKLIHFTAGRELKDIPYLIRTHKIAIYK